MENQLVKEYTNQGLSRLSKEKLVYIVSNLMNMPTEVAMKISEHIPAFFDICDKALCSTDSLYKDAIEQNERLAQQEIDMWSHMAELREKSAVEAETQEEKEQYKREANEARGKIAALREKVLVERNAMIKNRSIFYAEILGVMAATLGVAIKIGKKFW